MNYSTGHNRPLTDNGLSASQNTLDHAKRLMRHYQRQAKHLTACSHEGQQLLRKMLELVHHYSLK